MVKWLKKTRRFEVMVLLPMCAVRALNTDEVQMSRGSSSDTLGSQLVDRLLTPPLHGFSLDSTTLGKPGRVVLASRTGQRLLPERTNPSSPGSRVAQSSPGSRVTTRSVPRVARAPQGGSRLETSRTPQALRSRRQLGFVRSGVDISTLPSSDEADRWLDRFEKGYETGGANAALWQKPLRASCRSQAARARRVLMGFCASNVDMGLNALKAWVTDLGLPRGRLFGLDKDGVPIPPPKGPVYIKYSSDNGDAEISSYSGRYRGVVFTPQLTDGKFRQFGHLPLALLSGGEPEAIPLS